MLLKGERRYISAAAVQEAITVAAVRAAIRSGPGRLRSVSLPEPPPDGVDYGRGADRSVSLMIFL